MNTKSLLIGTVAVVALTGTVNAGQLNGWYVGLEGGANWVQDWDHTTFSVPPGASSPVGASFDTGWVVLASVGYGWRHWRLELEAGWRENDLDTYTVAGVVSTGATGNLSEASLMVNVLYDIPVTERVMFSLGAGAGGDFAESETGPPPVSADTWDFAYQGIAGLSYDVGPRTALFVNYRYFRVHQPEFDYSPVFAFRAEGDDIVKHTATIGLRYAFGAAAEPEAYVAPPPPPPAQEIAAPAEFIVFFGHNKTILVPEAMKVIREAATAAKQYGSASISVVGHADRSGSTNYNDALSLRRGNVVKDALAGEGVPSDAISVSARGESEPLVSTADGVREPQNRRVNIKM